MATLIVERGLNMLAWATPMNVYINGFISGSVDNDSTKKFKIQPGRVSVQLKWDIFGARDGDPVQFHNVGGDDVIKVHCYPSFPSNKITSFADEQIE